jgi:alkanesulfonate monooxygenase SsuD/methylene tetrahydromethanopterin reductase-like flavin-dependent oxidoreductase (luciferase family)
MERKGDLMPGTHPLRVGLVVGQRESWPELVRRAQLVESMGLDTIWVVDHFFGGSDEMGDTHEAYTVLAGLAVATERVRMGVMVAGNNYRNPVVLLKQAVTVDHISNGRVDFGIGAGWWEREYEAFSYEFPSAGDRVSMFEEALEAIDSFQHNPRTNYHGKFYQYVNTPFEPKAVQESGLPIVVGAGGPRMLGITAKHADIWNTRSPLEEAKRRSNVLDEKCREIGRDPGEIMRSVWPGQNQLGSLDNLTSYIESFREQGFDDFLFAWPENDDELAVITEAAATVIPGMRG